MGISLTETQQQQLVGYAALLTKWNKTFNLVSRQDMARLGPRHLLDSLCGVGLLAGQHVLDLGSGAGLPGVPLAIAAPDKHFVLCDRSARRTRFLTQVVITLGLEHVTVWQGDYGVEFPSGTDFDTVVARGVVTAAEVWAMVQPQLAAGGRVLVYERTRGVEAQDREAIEQGEVHHPADVEVSHHSFEIPGLDQEHTIVCWKRS